MRPAWRERQRHAATPPARRTDRHPHSTVSETEIKDNGARMVHHIGDISYARGYAVTWEAWFDLISPYSGVAPYMIGM